MSTLSLTGTLKKQSKATTRINRNSKLFKTILLAVQEKKAEEIVSLDLRKIPEAVADFFIICQATSTTQVKAIADNVEQKVKEVCLELPYRHEGMTAAQWVLVDYINIVVHIFQPETRKFYRLEEMWSDADLQEHL
ncbi:ribosome silencing factor [Lacibacter sp. MH-610]|uniref:ribosome silencing factor n=1 Tax=Lacibacter sp. MH-610 TaxID=3020883 RepID=UPI00389139DF